jgi:uncharacterized protein (TIGR02246 family)
MYTATKTQPAIRPTDVSPDEAEIRRMIAAWSRALEAKDVDGLTKDYAPDAMLFDVKPPHKLTGAAAIRQVWQDCFPFFPAKFKSEHHDLRLTVGEDVAFVYGLHHIQPIDPPTHPAGQSWMRVTACYKKVNGRWLVAHEHVSMPFDCSTGQIAPITNPDA